MQFPAEHPVMYYGALSAAMSACLYLFVTVSQKMGTMERRIDDRLDGIEKEAGVVGAQAGALDGRVKEMEETVAGLTAARRAQAMASGVDANQRTKVLRMARRGGRPEQIAAELGVPKSEVDLLVKVERALTRVS